MLCKGRSLLDKLQYTFLHSEPTRLRIRFESGGLLIRNLTV